MEFPRWISFAASRLGIGIKETQTLAGVAAGASCATLLRQPVHARAVDAESLGNGGGAHRKSAWVLRSRGCASRSNLSIIWKFAHVPWIRLASATSSLAPSGHGDPPRPAQSQLDGGAIMPVCPLLDGPESIGNDALGGIMTVLVFGLPRFQLAIS